jgi:hypothetical protein
VGLLHALLDGVGNGLQVVDLFSHSYDLTIILQEFHSFKFYHPTALLD